MHVLFLQQSLGLFGLCDRAPFIEGTTSKLPVASAHGRSRPADARVQMVMGLAAMEGTTSNFLGEDVACWAHMCPSAHLRSYTNQVPFLSCPLVPEKFFNTTIICLILELH